MLIRPLHDQFQNSVKAVIQKDTCPPAIIHSSTIHNSQDMEKPTYPSTDEWMTKMWYVYTTDYYIGIKKECHLQ